MARNLILAARRAGPRLSAHLPSQSQPFQAPSSSPAHVLTGSRRHLVCDGELEPAVRPADHHHLHAQRQHPVNHPESHGNELHAHGHLPVQLRAEHAQLQVVGFLAKTDLRRRLLHTGPAARADGRGDHQQHPVPQHYPVRRHFERWLHDLHPHQRDPVSPAVKALIAFRTS